MQQSQDTESQTYG